MHLRDQGAGRRAESRQELIARVTREQEALHPTPVYTERARRRLRAYLVAIWPAGIAVGWLAGLAFGWSVLEWTGFGVGVALPLAYIGYVLLAERDDGRIHRDVSRLRRDGPAGGGA